LILLCASHLTFGQIQSDSLNIEQPNDFDKWFEDLKRERDSLQQIVNDSVEKNPYLGGHRFWISSLDKAGNQRITYEVRDIRLIVKEGPYDFIYFAPNYYADKIRFDTSLNTEYQEKLKSLMTDYKRDSLKSIYSNTCIIDGLILHFKFEWGDAEMSSTISNYYLEKVVPAIDFINGIVPKEFHIYYDQKWLLEHQNNCDLLLD